MGTRTQFFPTRLKEKEEVYCLKCEKPFMSEGKLVRRICKPCTRLLSRRRLSNYNE